MFGGGISVGIQDGKCVDELDVQYAVEFPQVNIVDTTLLPITTVKHLSSRP